nr:immunoglobulin heavy chain junction region [Macaca mulatta]MOV88319.1 immunoglobulin heavy chain junction region [Macaca mulatta]MOV90175.1 immunoglobulin heavy chain junction region [Macaca mulatta]MOV90626.1 immunoglobulin heavy chain junction region [Macaca mulatta]MOV91266.1 immunoglobulin heavy chain junction region [Macaca mulatta]
CARLQRGFAYGRGGLDSW